MYKIHYIILYLVIFEIFLKIAMNYQVESSKSEHIYDVVIVGAGPVGLGIALGLKKRGVDNILVIDQTREFRQVGQVIDLLPNGLKAIKYLDPIAYDRVKEARFDISGSKQENQKDNSRFWHNRNLQGEIIRSIPLRFEDWFKQYGEGRISIRWYDLQTTLRKMLPTESVKANHRCISIEENADFITVNCASDTSIENNPFANWNLEKSAKKSNNSGDTQVEKITQNQKIKAKIIIGSDGINSTIRNQIYAHTELEKWSKPEYSGWTGISCFSIDNVPDSIIKELAEKYLKDNKIVSIISDTKKSKSTENIEARIILIRHQYNSMGFLFHGTLDLKLVQEQPNEFIIKYLVEIVEKSDYPDSIAQLIRLTPLDKIINRPYYIHSANIPVENQILWTKGRIILVGDAAHGMPPFAAQGANQGFEDAAIVTTLINKIVKNNDLDNQTIITKEFAKYEEIRRPFMVKMQTATMNNQKWSKQQWDDYQTMVYSRDFENFCNSIS
ncbi:NAD(P)/FAD-dependent oxidoreductase [Crocosphaera sp. UHCC 0190]|uniref:FAD-dependent oxidoreductase n=1 Tax=Crocosphaera sp. UHCC 0190 TaxID=3110246 RepID=UPI002B202931|nr:NAD(P)/FAD-dependent oxidoreductase [Crocosphaera sp. UHCC 0190]MEA5511305.1 NAD(P)/FAD-dependent oxidoreductase [Crocosphaera sp. UHCC 0190]